MGDAASEEEERSVIEGHLLPEAAAAAGWRISDLWFGQQCFVLLEREV